MSSVNLRSIAATRGMDIGTMGPNPMAGADADMRHVLDVFASLETRPIESCSPEEARAQPPLAAALGRILRDRADESGVGMEMRMIPGPAGDIRARVYSPLAGNAGSTLPMILYIHGGGWVVGDLDSDDATARALARRCGALVVSTHYRQAPEFKFPAAHEDTFAAWRWILENAEMLGGDPERAAIVGEDAGGNMAVNIALEARREGITQPRHLVLISPMAGTDFSRPSCVENVQSRPLGTETVRWFYRKALRKRSGLTDPRLNLIERGDLEGLPPTTIILASIDPLLSEGEALADAMRRSGVWVDITVYDGVTHYFFGLGRIVNKAMFAQSQVTRNLAESFAQARQRNTR